MPTQKTQDQEATGRALRILRTARSLKQTEVCERAGFAVSQLSRWEQGAMKPTLESIERLMGALDLPLEALLEAQRFVRRIEESTRRGGWPGLPGSAWVRSDEVREARPRWPAESVAHDFGAEVLARLFRAWIREEIARTVGRS